MFTKNVKDVFFTNTGDISMKMFVKGAGLASQRLYIYNIKGIPNMCPKCGIKLNNGNFESFCILCKTSFIRIHKYRFGPHIVSFVSDNDPIQVYVPPKEYSEIKIRCMHCFKQVVLKRWYNDKPGNAYCSSCGHLHYVISLEHLNNLKNNLINME